MVAVAGEGVGKGAKFLIQVLTQGVEFVWIAVVVGC